jgi:hypothetical protein
VVVYLNGGYDGGETEFLEGGIQINSENSDTSEVLFSTTNEVLARVKPKIGKCLIFLHEALHQSAPVYRGVKYILRTELIFRRVDTYVQEDPIKFQNDPKYIKFLKLYRKSHENLALGNPGKFFDLYYQALKLQVEAQREQKLPEVTALSKRTFPEEIWLYVLSFFDAFETRRLFAVSKDFYDLAIDGQLWKVFYEHRWPKPPSESPIRSSSTPEIHSENPSESVHKVMALDWILHPYLEDWYGKYWFRIRLQSSPNIIDIGTCTINFLLDEEDDIPYNLTRRIHRKFYSLPAKFDVPRMIRVSDYGHYRPARHELRIEFGRGTPILTKNEDDASGLTWSVPKGDLWEMMNCYFLVSRWLPNIYLNSPYPRLIFPVETIVRETSVSTIKSYRLRSGVVVSFGDSGAWLEVVSDLEIIHTEIFAKTPEDPEEYSAFLASRFSAWLAENKNSSFGLFNFCFIGPHAVEENVAIFLSILDLQFPFVEYKVVSSEKDRLFAPLVGAK